jgi:tetratricopeptide (TPR) repeat protein
MCQEMQGMEKSPANATKWWIAMGYPDWDAAPDGFPEPGQVVAYFRRKTIKTNGRSWTQKDLALALNITEQAVINMEKRNTGLDSLSRREFLIGALGIPPILLHLASFPLNSVLEGMATQPNTVTSSHAPDLADFRTAWHTYSQLNHRLSAQKVLPEMEKRIAALYGALPFSHEPETILELLCLYHILFGSILRDQQQFAASLTHLDKAVKLAENLGNDELHVDSLYGRGNTGMDSDDSAQALQDYTTAQTLLSRVPSYMGSGVLLKLGLAQARQAHDVTDKRRALSTIDKAVRLIAAPQAAADEHYFKVDLSRYHIDRSAALIAIDWPHDALTELSSVQRTPELTRRNAYTDILEAQASFKLGEYDQTAMLLQDVVPALKRIHSTLNYQRVQQLYEQLKQTSFAHDPEVALLAYLLQTD